MPKGEGIAYIVRLYLYFCVISKVFCKQLYDIKYFYRTQTIFKQTYYTNRLSYFTISKKYSESWSNYNVSFTLYSPNLQNWSLTIRSNLVSYPEHLFWQMLLVSKG